MPTQVQTPSNFDARATRTLRRTAADVHREALAIVARNQAVRDWSMYAAGVIGAVVIMVFGK